MLETFMWILAYVVIGCVFTGIANAFCQKEGEEAEGPELILMVFLWPIIGVFAFAYWTPKMISRVVQKLIYFFRNSEGN